MLVVDIPTGYLMEQPTADRIVRSGVVPEMRDADVLKPGKTIWYFDHIPNVTRCFEHTVRNKSFFFAKTDVFYQVKGQFLGQK